MDPPVMDPPAMDFLGARVAVLGLGYVGLPLAAALARSHGGPVVGFDIDGGRVDELRRGHDRTGELANPSAALARLSLTDRPADLNGAQVFIITVPTPVGPDNTPDLGAVEAAAASVGAAIRRGGVVVLESTVYPGVTEDVCGRIVAARSGLTCGADFFLGYSPERINPGDRAHAIERVTKVVAGQTPQVAAALADLYGQINGGDAFVAASIRAAEAAKVIENAQRDVNIAFINEVTRIFHRLGLSAHDVLAASATKWNFLDFRPGLVGGHCIGVDPYYLASAAQGVGYDPEIILAGRRINDGMAAYLARAIADRLAPAARVLVLGLTFKENVPDLRNSKVADLVARLAERGHDITVHDPHADPAEAKAVYNITLCAEPSNGAPHDAVVAAVAHHAYAAWTAKTLAKLTTADALIVDIKNMWPATVIPPGRRCWRI